MLLSSLSLSLVFERRRRRRRRLPFWTRNVPPLFSLSFSFFFFDDLRTQNYKEKHVLKRRFWMPSTPQKKSVLVLRRIIAKNTMTSSFAMINKVRRRVFLFLFLLLLFRRRRFSRARKGEDVRA